MGKMKWGQIAIQSQNERYQLLSKKIAEKNIENEFTAIEVSLDKYPEAIIEYKNIYDQLLIGPKLGTVAFQNLDQIVGLVQQLNSVDALVKESGRWLSRCYKPDAIISLLARKETYIDSSASAMVVGSGAAARAALYVVVKLGFKKIYLVDQSSDESQRYTEEARRTYFDIEFPFVTTSELHLLPGTCSLMINCTSYDSSEEILKDLTYLNFLQSGGAVIDMTISHLPTTLAQEGKEAGAQIILGHEVAASYDCLWCQKVLGVEIDFDVYEKELQSSLVR